MTESKLSNWTVHPRESMRVVLADYIETTICRTHCGMFSDADNAKHAELIVQAVNSHESLVKALEAINDLLFGLQDYFELGHELSQINAQRDKNIELLAALTAAGKGK